MTNHKTPFTHLTTPWKLHEPIYFPLLPKVYMYGHFVLVSRSLGVPQMSHLLQSQSNFPFSQDILLVGACVVSTLN